MNLWSLFFALLAYALICQLSIVGQLIKHRVPVPWFTLAVPLHLFQRCREHRARLGFVFPWLALSVDLAVLSSLALVLVSWLQQG